MPVWRCPHCATPQPESSRCWVCRRSTTSCGTCRHFRRGVAGGLGLCGLDPKHPALTGSEMRACWTAAPPPPDPADRRLVPVGPGRRTGRDEVPGSTSGRQPRTFVPVETAAGGTPSMVGMTAGPEPDADETHAAGTTDGAVARASAISPATGAASRVPGTWWLWGDPEPWPDL